MVNKIFVPRLKGEKRKKIRELLNKQIELRRKQIELIEKLFINPLKKMIKITEDTMKGHYPLEFYVKYTKSFSERFKNALEGTKKNK